MSVFLFALAAAFVFFAALAARPARKLVRVRARRDETRNPHRRG